MHGSHRWTGGTRSPTVWSATPSSWSALAFVFRLLSWLPLVAEAEAPVFPGLMLGGRTCASRWVTFREQKAELLITPPPHGPQEGCQASQGRDLGGAREQVPPHPHSWDCGDGVIAMAIAPAPSLS